jgi:hypothetical protein
MNGLYPIIRRVRRPMVVLEDGREQPRIIGEQASAASDQPPVTSNQSAPVPAAPTAPTVMAEPQKEHDCKAEINHPPGKAAGRRAKVA